ncbi:MAG: hypothetical protein JXA19_03610 [Anaerolineales bacterium]|nr:hypothetical protein [Anaerolineales bacterium]
MPSLSELDIVPGAGSILSADVAIVGFVLQLENIIVMTKIGMIRMNNAFVENIINTLVLWKLLKLYHYGTKRLRLL